MCVRGHEHVQRLEIAMHDEVLVRISHRVAHGEEKAEAMLDVETVLVAVACERNAVDELHGEPWATVVQNPAVHQPGDVGVIQASKDLSLDEESATRMVRVQLTSNELECDALLVLAVGSFGDVHGAHAASRQLAEHAIGTNERGWWDIGTCERRMNRWPEIRCLVWQR